MRKTEKDRALSEAEQRRLDHFEKVKQDLLDQGYTVKELTIGIVRANVYVLLMAIPVLIVTLVPFFLLHHGEPFLTAHSFRGLLLELLALLVLVVVHELIHGLTWGICSQNHFKDIEFGFMKEYLTPYCTCSVPLGKGQYVLGALMPLITLGIIPAVIAIITGWFPLLFLSIVMILAAGGDVMIVAKLLSYHTDAKEMLIYDHPTQAGSVVFERRSVTINH